MELVCGSLGEIMTTVLWAITTVSVITDCIESVAIVCAATVPNDLLNSARHRLMWFFSIVCTLYLDRYCEALWCPKQLIPFLSYFKTFWVLYNTTTTTEIWTFMKRYACTSMSTLISRWRVTFTSTSMSCSSHCRLVIFRHVSLAKFLLMPFGSLPSMIGTSIASYDSSVLSSATNPLHGLLLCHKTAANWIRKMLDLLISDRACMCAYEVDHIFLWVELLHGHSLSQWGCMSPAMALSASTCSCALKYCT